MNLIDFLIPYADDWYNLNIILFDIIFGFLFIRFFYIKLKEFIKNHKSNNSEDS